MSDVFEISSDNVMPISCRYRAKYQYRESLLGINQYQVHLIYVTQNLRRKYVRQLSVNCGGPSVAGLLTMRLCEFSGTSGGLPTLTNVPKNAMFTINTAITNKQPQSKTIHLRMILQFIPINHSQSPFRQIIGLQGSQFYGLGF